MKFSSILSLTVVAGAVSAHADRVDDLIRREMKVQNIPGVSLLITKGDKVIKRSAYGFADLGLKVKMQPDMSFESGSIGKSFTATIVMQLWEQGKLSLDDPVSKYIEKTPASWKHITIRRMLSHTSGLPDYALAQELRLNGEWTTEQWMTRMSALPLDFETGRQFAYSNSNYLLLGLVCEKIAGHPIDQLVMERIFKPLGMTHSRPSNDDIVEGRVHGYFPGEHGLIEGIKIINGYGDGGELNTPKDLVTFERGFREAKLLKPETVALMQTSCLQPNGRRTSYGFGWFDRKIYGHRYISHGGNTGGCGSSMTRIPDKDLTIVVMTNQANVGGDGLAQKISVALDPDLGPKPVVESPDPNPEFSKKLQKALVGLSKGELTQPLYSAEMAANLATGRGKMMLPQYAPFGAMKSFSFCSIEQDAPDKIYRYRVKTADKSYIVGFWIDRDEKIYSASIRPE